MAAPSPADPHLDAALRHAPDADEAPPPALSREILRAAHEAVSEAAPRQPAASLGRSALERLQRWLLAPQLAGSAAALMLVVVIGSLWWRAPEEASPVPRRETLPLPAAAPPGESANAGAPASGAVPPMADQAPEAAKSMEDRKSPPRVAQRALAAKAGRERLVVAPVAAPPPAPRGLAETPPQAAASEPPGLARLRLGAAAAQDSAGNAAPRRAEPAAARLAFARAPSLQGWLLQLSRAAAGHWVQQPAGAVAPSGAPAWSVAWPAGAGPAATVSLHGRTLWWREADGTLWTAELPAGAEPPAPPEPAASAAR